MTDVIVRPHGPPVHGSDRAATVRLAPGGSGANQAAWLAALGVPVALAARVGAADHAAQAAALRAHGVTPLLAADAALPTGMLVALLDPDGERSFLTDRGANAALCRADLPDAIGDAARLVHVSGYALFAPGSRAAVRDFVAGRVWTVDASSSGFLAEAGAARFLDWTDGADTLFANADEAAVLAGSDDPTTQLAMLAARYRCVVVKRGAAGAVALAQGGLSCTVPAPQAEARDTTGAGDAFLAGFLAAWLAGAELARCLTAGVARGAQAVTLDGGRPRAMAADRGAD